MNLVDRIEVALIKRRAEKKLRAHEEMKAARDHLNRPHVQSVHMIGHFVPPPAPTVRDYGITRRYVALVFILFGVVAYANVYHPETARPYACTQIASK